MQKDVPVVVVVLVGAEEKIVAKLAKSERDAFIEPGLLPGEYVQLRRTKSWVGAARIRLRDQAVLLGILAGGLIGECLHPKHVGQDIAL